MDPKSEPVVRKGKPVERNGVPLRIPWREIITDFLNLDSAIMVNFHIKAVDQAEAIKTIKRKLTDIEKTKIEEQVRPARA